MYVGSIGHTKSDQGPSYMSYVKLRSPEFTSSKKTGCLGDCSKGMFVSRIKGFI